MSDEQVTNQRELRAALLEALHLKALPRAGWMRVGVAQPESVAAHSWGVAWLVLNLCPPDVDRARALELAVIHDVAEVRSGDITPYDGISAEQKSAVERASMEAMVRDLPARAHLLECWEEYEAAESKESVFVKACDKLDMALQASLYQSDDVNTAEFIESAMRRLQDSDWRVLLGAHAVSSLTALIETETGI